MQRAFLLAAILLIAIVAACAGQTSPQSGESEPNGRDCFDVQFLTGYDTVDRDTLRVDAGSGESYDVDISGTQCSQIDWAHRVAIESTSSSWICVGSQPGQGRIGFRDPTTNRRMSCYIANVRRVPVTAPEQR